MTQPRMTVRFAAVTHPGQVRPDNEDACLAVPPVFLVADGMGGHEGGERASGEVRRRFQESCAGEWLSGAEITRIVRRAADNIESLEHRGRPPGSTVAGVALARYAGTPCWLVFNIGDSRVYLMRSGELRQISVDHSVGSHSGKGDRPRLTRALGAGLGSPVADQWLIRARVGDRMLVCTDGLSNAVAREQLAAAMVGDDDPQETVQRLLDEALAAGGRDNVSLAVVDCLEVIQVAGGELDDVMSLDESEEETVSWNHDDTIPDPEGK